MRNWSSQDARGKKNEFVKTPLWLMLAGRALFLNHGPMHIITDSMAA